MTARALLLFGLTLLAAEPAFAQSAKSTGSAWGEPADLKPLVPVLPRVFIPPNSSITSGPASSASPYSSGPLYDPTRDQATPGLRLTIPSR